MRAAVEDEVVKGEDEQVVGGAEADQRGPEQGAAGEVEGLLGLPRAAAAPRPRAAPWQGREVDLAAAARGRAGAMRCTGWPSRVAKVVRSGSWRRTISARARRRAPPSRRPRSRRPWGR